jgi:hypothetical protein
MASAATRRIDRAMATKLRRLVLLLLVLVGLPAASAGCGEPDIGWEELDVGGRPVDRVQRFPERAAIDYAMTTYARDPARARAESPMSVSEFFGTKIESMNIQNLRVELLRGSGREGVEKPIGFLWTQFHDGDPYWNNRYKDVQLYRLVDATGNTHNPFPEATHVPHEGSALVRLWTDYRPVSKGAPDGLQGEELVREVARLAVWSYVSGNLDGPATNGNNGGFARFRDASGREFWRAVLIDAGAAWNQPSDAHRPWNTNLFGTGPVARESIPNGAVNSLVQIARASAEELAEMSKFERVDDGALAIVRGIRGRAREVLDHYEIPWE